MYYVFIGIDKIKIIVMCIAAQSMWREQKVQIKWGLLILRTFKLLRLKKDIVLQ